MCSITGFVPTGQQIDLSWRSRRLPEKLHRSHPRSAGRGVAGFVLLLIGFCLLILGGTFFTAQRPSTGAHQPGNGYDGPLATVANRSGGLPAGVVQPSGSQGFHFASAQQRVDTVVEEAREHASEVLALLAQQQRRLQTSSD